jgi:hypothetical protein
MGITGPGKESFITKGLIRSVEAKSLKLFHVFFVIFFSQIIFSIKNNKKSSIEDMMLE